MLSARRRQVGRIGARPHRPGDEHPDARAAADQQRAAAEMPLFVVIGHAPDAVADRPRHSNRSCGACRNHRSEEHTSELQSLMRISYAVLCLKKKNKTLY